MVWFDVEKWMPDGTGKLICSYDYTILNRKICYSDCHISSAWTSIDFGLFNDLRNIPIPFHAGDIVTLDCRPFAPVSHVIILEIGDNRDCCCLQALYREENGTWDTGADQVKELSGPGLRFLDCLKEHICQIGEIRGIFIFGKQQK